MNRKVLIVGLLVALPMVAILLVNLGRNPHEIKSPLIGKVAPQFALKEVGSGRVVSLSEFRGKPVVVNFWATWCVPCYTEHPVLTSSAAAMGNSVQFLGVVYEDTEDKIQQFVRENGASYPSLMDDAGKTAIAYGVYGVPETFFVSPGGTIVHKHQGPLDRETLAQNIRRATSAQ